MADEEEVGASETGVPPHVFVLILDRVSDGGDSDSSVPASRAGRVEGVFTSWKKESGTCRFVPGRAPNVAGVLYGEHPLQLGVVCDLDWRRKPVMATSIANVYQDAGYQTVFLGEWGMGVVPPYGPLNRGFNEARISSTRRNLEAPESESFGDTLTDDHPETLGRADFLVKLLDGFLSADKPLMCVCRQGRYLNELVLREVMKRCLVGEKNRPVVCFILRSDAVDREAVVGSVPDRYYNAGHWTIFRHGGGQAGKIAEGITGDAAMRVEMKSVKNVWEVHRGLMALLGKKSQPQPQSPVFIYHKASWPMMESPEKYRHRNSLVMGDDVALVDGLEMFAQLRKGGPDFSKPLELAKHSDEHQKLLQAYGKWWQSASRSIRNPRPFTVGVIDHQSVRLTALDWRPSRVFDQQGKSPVTRPMVSMDTLSRTLNALKVDEKYRDAYPATSGSWSVDIKRPGRYKITAALNMKAALVDQKKSDAYQLNGGTAHFKLGRSEVELRIMKGASAISVLVDADAGVTDLECWFVGQLALERELGAFFVEIERVGEKKFEINLEQK